MKNKVRKMFGAEEKVSMDEGGYCCETFCHLLRLPKEKIEELQAFYKYNFSDYYFVCDEKPFFI